MILVVETVRRADESDIDEATRRVRLGIGLGVLSPVDPKRSIVLMTKDSDEIMVTSRADLGEKTRQSAPFWIVTSFHPRTRNIRAFISMLADELIALGEPDTPVRWRIVGKPTLDRAVDALVPPRIVDLNGRDVHETTARETRAILDGVTVDGV